MAWTEANSDLPVAIGEFGFVPDPDNVDRRPDYLMAAARYAIAHDFLALCYFDASISTPWWLRCLRNPAVRDDRSIAAWSQVYAMRTPKQPQPPAATVGFVGAAVAGGNTAKADLAWPPDGVQAGDTAILRWTHSTAGTPASGSPAGFTHHETFDGDGGSHRCSLWSMVCTGAESGSLRLALPAITRQSANLLVWRGLHPTDPVDTWAVRETPKTGTSHPCPTVMTGHDDCVIVAGYGERVSGGTANVDAPNGYVKRAGSGDLAVGAGGTTTATADDGLRAHRPAGTQVTPPDFASAVATDNVVTWTISLRPAD